jgi:hypothetical protein
MVPSESNGEQESNITSPLRGPLVLRLAFVGFFGVGMLLPLFVDSAYYNETRRSKELRQAKEGVE